ncbi:M48 family metallopeptidase [Thalassoporum mexicanum]|uniref:M48 family metallopeptidase n=1 Tax=Thalassoporum mexicanum TaxID=3457544 RepID=UPI000688E511|nr:M48 family metallopeptidase [Pseudanabaena sp. PCC 7367]
MSLPPIPKSRRRSTKLSTKLHWLTLPFGLLLLLASFPVSATTSNQKAAEHDPELVIEKVQAQAADRDSLPVFEHNEDSLELDLEAIETKTKIETANDASQPVDADSSEPEINEVGDRTGFEGELIPVEAIAGESEERDQNTVGTTTGKKGRAIDLLGDDATMISRPKPIERESLIDETKEANESNQADEAIAAGDDPDSMQLDLSEFSGVLEGKLNARQQKMIEADRLYRSGQIEQAEQLYREAKTGRESKLAARSIDDSDVTSESESLESGIEPDLESEDSLEPEQTNSRPTAIYDLAEASPAVQVYWREYQAGLEKNLETRILVPLQLLSTQHPEFIPGHIAYAEALEAYDRQEDALDALEQASLIYPDEPKLMLARIKKLGEAGYWLESSIAAREFALLNPEHEDAEEFLAVADENLDRFKDDIRKQLREKSITSAIVGAAGYALTGSLIGPLNSVQSLALIAQGEVVVGEKAATSAQRRLELIDDPLVTEYVQEVGQKLAAVSGRDEFNYEFYVIAAEEINAFAMPGGKIFINAGAIAKTNSEAELAGLLAHEISHAVLSHGFQLVTQSALNSNLFQFLPFGGTAANLFTLDYSREMERQADVLGTRILASSGYAADGLYNLMVTMGKEQKQSPPAWVSTHPETNDRVAYINSYINEKKYNRYAYEGLERHLQVQQRVLELMPDMVETEPEDKVYKLPNRLSGSTNP